MYSEGYELDKIKCECGDVNPEGTVLCEACGKPVERNQHIDGNDKTKLLNMRYEGSARRSQTYNRSIVDKIWNFFSSVKVGVWLIVLARSEERRVGKECRYQGGRYR